MKINRSGLFWGLLLIGAGVVALGQQMGYIERFTDPQFWIWVFALVSLVAVIEYALSGWKQWGWLFPTAARAAGAAPARGAGCTVRGPGRGTVRSETCGRRSRA